MPSTAIIGGGITILRPDSGSSVRFCVFAMVEIPEEICPVKATIELALLGPDNKVVSFDDPLHEVLTFEKPSDDAGSRRKRSG
jgi:hypothetical protein